MKDLRSLRHDTCELQKPSTDATLKVEAVCRIKAASRPKIAWHRRKARHYCVPNFDFQEARVPFRMPPEVPAGDDCLPRRRSRLPERLCCCTAGGGWGWSSVRSSNCRSWVILPSEPKTLFVVGSFQIMYGILLVLGLEPLKKTVLGLLGTAAVIVIVIEFVVGIVT